jgi:hypothetical protein
MSGLVNGSIYRPAGSKYLSCSIANIKFMLNKSLMVITVLNGRAIESLNSNPGWDAIQLGLGMMDIYIYIS